MVSLHVGSAHGWFIHARDILPSTQHTHLLPKDIRNASRRGHPRGEGGLRSRAVVVATRRSVRFKLRFSIRAGRVNVRRRIFMQWYNGEFSRRIFETHCWSTCIVVCFCSSSSKSVFYFFFTDTCSLSQSNAIRRFARISFSLNYFVFYSELIKLSILNMGVLLYVRVKFPQVRKPVIYRKYVLSISFSVLSSLPSVRLNCCACAKRGNDKRTKICNISLWLEKIRKREMFLTNMYIKVKMVLRAFLSASYLKIA